jgi:hypothetical protein
MNTSPPKNPRQAFAAILKLMTKALCHKANQLAERLEELAAEMGWTMNPEGGKRVSSPATFFKWMSDDHCTKDDQLVPNQYDLLPFLEKVCHQNPKLALALPHFKLAKKDAPEWLKAIDFQVISKPGASQHSDWSQNDSLQIGDPKWAQMLLKDKEQKLKQSQGLKDSGAEMECLFSIASLAAELEDWPKAMDCRKAIVRLHEEGKDCLRLATALTDLARDQYSSGIYIEAIENLKTAKSILLDLNNPNLELLCETLDYIGVCTRALSRENQSDNAAYPLREAREGLNEALGIREKLHSPAGIAKTLHRLGHLLTQVAYLEEKDGTRESFQNAFRAAEENLKKAMELRKKHGLRLDYCRSANQYVSLFVTFYGKSPPKQFSEKEIRLLLEETTQLSKESGLRKIWFQSLITTLRFERKVQNYTSAIEVFDAANQGKDVAFPPSAFERAKLIEQRAKIAGAMLDSTESDWWRQAANLWRSLGDEKRSRSAAKNSTQASVNELTSGGTSSANTERKVAN